MGWRQLGPKKNLTSCPELVDHYKSIDLHENHVQPGSPRRVACAWAPIFHAQHVGGHRSVSLAIEVPRESKLVMACCKHCISGSNHWLHDRPDDPVLHFDVLRCPVFWSERLTEWRVCFWPISACRHRQLWVDPSHTAANHPPRERFRWKPFLITLKGARVSKTRARAFPYGSNMTSGRPASYSSEISAMGRQCPGQDAFLEFTSSVCAAGKMRA